MKASEKKLEYTLPGVGSLLRESYEILKKDPYVFFGYSAWLLVPIALNLLFSLALPESLDALADAAFSLLAYTILGLWAVVCITLQTKKIIAREKTDSVQVSQRGWQLLIPFLLAVILLSVLKIVGLALAIIPGILFWIWYAFAPTIIVLEGGGFVQAFQQSKQLVKGRFSAFLWRQAAGNLVIALAYLAIYFVLISAYLGNSGLDVMTYLEAPVSLTEEIINAALEVLFLPIFTIYGTILYLEAKK